MSSVLHRPRGGLLRATASCFKPRAPEPAVDPLERVGPPPARGEPLRHLPCAPHALAFDGAVPSLEAGIARGFTHFVIITRCSTVALRVRRMVAEGAPLEVTIHFPGFSDVPTRVDSNGEVNIWPEGLFAEDLEEAKAIRRAAEKKAARW